MIIDISIPVNSCYHDSMSSKRGRPAKAKQISHVCGHCGKEYTRPEWRKYGDKFCSNVCYWASKILPEELRAKGRECTCLFCKKVFYSWHKHPRYCSHACSVKHHTKYATPYILSVPDAAYLAGILDGEGSIIQVKPHTWRVAIYQSDEPFILWVREVTGTGLAAKRPATSYAGKNLVKQGVFKVGWHWQLYGHNAALFIRQLLPYLRIKRALAEEMLKDYAHDAAQHDS